MFSPQFMTRRSTRRAVPAGRRHSRDLRPVLESMEGRQLLTTLSVDFTQPLRTITNPNMIGANIENSDPYVATTFESSEVASAGLKTLRLSGGAAGDDQHFTDFLTSGDYPPSVTDMAALAQRSGANAMLTINYGGGSPQEAAAYLAYLTGDPSKPDVPLGIGRYYDSNTGQWENKDWHTANYWASLRGSAPYSIQYAEVGNEVYGFWNPDHHGTDPQAPGDQAHDPTTYVNFVKQFAALAARINPSVKIGVDVATPTPGAYLNWDSQVLAQCASGTPLVPGFLADHNYMFDVGDENDQTLLKSTATVGLPNTDSVGAQDDVSWSTRISTFRNLLSQDFGAAASTVQVIATEFNSVAGGGDNISKQTTSLVNGLFLADAVGGLLQPGYNAQGQPVYAGYDGGYVWAFRNNYYGTGPDNQRPQSLYGWRTGADYGLFGADQWNGGGNAQSSLTTPYPSFYGMQLASKLVTPGATVIKASSDSNGLSVYAVRQTNGTVTLLVINKNAPGTANADVNATIQFAGLFPQGTFTVQRYGVDQDNAQKNGQAVDMTLPSFTVLNLGSPSFTYSFPAYSMTVIQGSDCVTPLTVTNLNDSGPGSLRDAITRAEASPNSDVIVFAPNLAGGTITLTTAGDQSSQASAFKVSTRIAIVGNGEILNVSGSTAMRHFLVTANGVLALQGLTLSGGHETTGTLSQGGSILSHGKLTLTEVSLRNNSVLVQSGNAFGGAVFSDGMLNAVRSLFASNTAGPLNGTSTGRGAGGAVYNYGSAYIVNCTFTQNLAASNVASALASGGAISNQGGAASFINVTIAANRLSNPQTTIQLGAGIDNHANSSSAGGPGLAALTIQNSILWGNTGGLDLVNRVDPGQNVPVTSATYNVVGTRAQSGPGTMPLAMFLGGDPLLGPLADNGGPTWTMSIASNSIARNRGSNRYGNGVDQRGQSRNDGQPDLGAYEYKP